MGFWCFIVLKFFHLSWDDYPGPKLDILSNKWVNEWMNDYSITSLTVKIINPGIMFQGEAYWACFHFTVFFKNNYFVSIIFIAGWNIYEEIVQFQRVSFINPFFFVLRDRRHICFIVWHFSVVCFYGRRLLIFGL